MASRHSPGKRRLPAGRIGATAPQDRPYAFACHEDDPDPLRTGIGVDRAECRTEGRFDLGRFAFVHLQHEGAGQRRSWLGVVRDLSTSGLSVYAMCPDAPEVGQELSLERHFFYQVHWRQPLDGGFVLGLHLLHSEADIFSVLPLEP